MHLFLHFAAVPVSMVVFIGRCVCVCVCVRVGVAGAGTFRPGGYGPAR